MLVTPSHSEKYWLAVTLSSTFLDESRDGRMSGNVNQICKSERRVIWQSHAACGNKRVGNVINSKAWVAFLVRMVWMTWTLVFQGKDENAFHDKSSWTLFPFHSPWPGKFNNFSKAQFETPESIPNTTTAFSEKSVTKNKRSGHSLVCVPFNPFRYLFPICANTILRKWVHDLEFSIFRSKGPFSPFLWHDLPFSLSPREK